MVCALLRFLVQPSVPALRDLRCRHLARLLNTVRVLCSADVRVLCSTPGRGRVLDVLCSASGVLCITIICIRMFCSTGGIRAVVGVGACPTHLCSLAVLMVFGFR